jgi:hypothetical protein
MSLSSATTQWLLGWCLAAGTAGGQADLPVPIQTAREALRSQSDLPWYDPASDSLRRIEVAPSTDDPRRNSRWSTESAGRESTGSGSSWIWQIMQMLAWIALGVLLATIIALLAWAARRWDAGGAAGEASVKLSGAGGEQLEELPVSIPRTERDLLEAARSRCERGDYDQAIVYFYAYQLVELDKRHAIQLARGKTNRQYLRELRTWPRLQELLRPTVLAFEDAFFGHHPLSWARFQGCWDTLNEFQGLLERVG